jgi:hypothetical protein
MTVVRRIRTLLAVVALGILLVPTAGCGMPSGATDSPRVAPPPPPTPLPVPTPAPPPPPSRPPDARLADEGKLQNLIQGKTTKEEVRALFGTPQEIVLSPSVESYIYYRDKTSGWIFRTSERVEMLTVRFDGGGVLKDFEYRYAGE